MITLDYFALIAIALATGIIGYVIGLVDMGQSKGRTL